MVAKELGEDFYNFMQKTSLCRNVWNLEAKQKMALQELFFLFFLLNA